jgi:hypothetical protein
MRYVRDVQGRDEPHDVCERVRRRSVHDAAELHGELLSGSRLFVGQLLRRRQPRDLRHDGDLQHRGKSPDLRDRMFGRRVYVLRFELLSRQRLRFGGVLRRWGSRDMRHVWRLSRRDRADDLRGRLLGGSLYDLRVELLSGPQLLLGGVLRRERPGLVWNLGFL